VPGAAGSTITGVSELRPGATPEGLQHPALLYATEDEFLECMVPYITQGIDRGEPVFIAVSAGPLAGLREAVGSDASGVALEDTRVWYPDPTTRLRALHDLVTTELSAGASAVRLACEPVWPSGDPDLEREWQRYESVLNEVLAPFPVTLVCTYDTSSIDPSIAAVARRTHPVVREGEEGVSPDFEAPAEFLRRWNVELAPPPADADVMSDPSDLAATRRFLLEQSMRVGLGRDRTSDLCVAANEVLTNAVVHGRGPTSLLAWTEGTVLVCQIDDHGPGIDDPVAGYRPPPTTAEHGRGLWLARQLVDLIQIVPGPDGTSVRLRTGRR
jgi:anti-sigma regulatory factor (Ser/Thr protein kinase)